MKSILSNLMKNTGARFLRAAFSALLIALATFFFASAELRQTIEPHAEAATFVVTTTASSGPGSLTAAVTAVQNDSAHDTISFNIPPSDPRHFYYRNDNVAGTVSRSMIAATTAADDSQIADIDPDWAHSWYSIAINVPILELTTPATIDGFTQPGTAPNTNAAGTLNSVLRIEVTTSATNCGGIFLNYTAPVIYRGLIVNGCSANNQNTGSKMIDFEISSNGSIAAGNYLGTDASGTIALGGGYGVHVTRTSSVRIGGSTPAERNLISGNFRGININNGGVSGFGISNNQVIGNLIGTKRDGVSPLGNGFSAIFPTLPEDGVAIGTVNGAALNNRIENNIIAFNARYGIHIGGGGVGTTNQIAGNRILNNSIHSNGNIGINLDGNDQGANTNPVTPNDACDADSGVNSLQNYPVLSSTAVSVNTLTIRGTLHSTAGGTFTVQFFSSPSPDRRGFGEGKTFLGSTTVTDSDNDCNMSFTVDVPRPAAGETIISSTATDADGNTSEFSATIRVKNALYDFDGDLKTDISIFRPQNGQWWIYRSSDSQVSVIPFGVSTDKITPADFTGDGKTDPAVFRPSTGEWFVLRSEDGSYYAFPFGTSEDIPIPGDYDNDGKSDAAVFRPSTGEWYILNSLNGEVSIIRFGRAGDIPVSMDFNGDGKAEIAVFRPNGTNGAEWWIRGPLSTIIQYGISTDKPVPADYTGDGRADLAVFRPSTGEWYILRSDDSQTESYVFGAPTDIPVPGDYNGDGRSRIVVYRPNGSNSAEWRFRSSGLTAIIPFGLANDRPVPGWFNLP